MQNPKKREKMWGKTKKKEKKLKEKERKIR
jgi:hypothetical protein